MTTRDPKLEKDYFLMAQAEIEIQGADDLYKEIRIENKLVDSEGKKVKLKPNASVDVTVEAGEKGTVPENDNE